MKRILERMHVEGMKSLRSWLIVSRVRLRKMRRVNLYPSEGRWGRINLNR